MSEDRFTGQILSHYRIVKHLASGGMGSVYLAEDIRLERTVAIKILPVEVASDEERMLRFNREAKALSAVDHPNIVHVYEISEAEGVNFIAMQYVEGQTLQNKIEGHPLEVEELVDIAIQATDAISEAHARGVIHRDLKPANIMVSNKGLVKVLDFGLARIEKIAASDQASKLETQQETRSGIVMGTVAYMSPEQALGKPVDQRTDIFSLGLVFYQMATGKAPFHGANATETIDQILHYQPESIGRLNYQVPQELERIVRKCIEKDPDRRYQSASEVLIDLKNLKRDLQSGAFTESKQHLSSAPDTLQHKSAPRRYLLTAAVVVMIVLASAFLFYRYGRNSAGKEIQSLAVLPFTNVNVDPKTEYLSDGITDSIINNLSVIRQVRVMSRGTVFTYKNREVDPRQVGRELSVDAVVTGKLLQEGNSVVVRADLVDARDGRQIWGEQYNKALVDLLSLQTEISKEISDKLRIKLSEQEQSLVTKQPTSNNDAYQLYLKGQFFLLQRTPDSVNQAIRYFEQAIQKDPAYALAYDGLASCYSFLGINGAILGGLPPKTVMPKAKDNALKAIQLDPMLAGPHITLGQILFNYDFDWEGSERELDKALELNPNDSFAYGNRAFTLLALARMDDWRSSLQRFKDLDPGYTPGTLIAVGIQQYLARQNDAAIATMRKINEMAPNFPSPYVWLGAAYIEKKDYKHSLEAFQKAVDLSHRAPVALIGMGIGFARAGKTAEAETVNSELLESSKSRYIPEFYWACLYVALGKKDEAFELLEKAVRERANGLSLIKVYPMVDDLRSDPRFDRLLQELKLK